MRRRPGRRRRRRRRRREEPDANAPVAGKREKTFLFPSSRFPGLQAGDDGDFAAAVVVVVVVFSRFRMGKRTRATAVVATPTAANKRKLSLLPLFPQKVFSCPQICFLSAPTALPMLPVLLA
jgi:hypothetical protein